MVLSGKKRYGTLLIMILKDFKELLDVEFNVFEDVPQCHIALLRGGHANAFMIVEKRGDHCGIAEKQKSSQIRPEWPVNVGAHHMWDLLRVFCWMWWQGSVPSTARFPEKATHSRLLQEAFLLALSVRVVDWILIGCLFKLTRLINWWVACNLPIAGAQAGCRPSTAHVPLHFSVAARNSWMLWHCFHLSDVSSLVKLYLDKYVKSQQMAKSGVFSPTLCFN